MTATFASVVNQNPKVAFSFCLYVSLYAFSHLNAQHGLWVEACDGNWSHMYNVYVHMYTDNDGGLKIPTLWSQLSNSKWEKHFLLEI